SPLDAGKSDRDSLPRFRDVHFTVVDLHAADTHLACTRIRTEHIAGSDPSRPESPGRDRPDPAQAEHAIDVESRRRVDSLAFDGGARQSSAQLVQSQAGLRA